MASVLLNMGCGYLPLVPDDLKINGRNIFDYVINYDPLYLVNKEDQEKDKMMTDMNFIRCFNGVERDKAQFTQYVHEIKNEIIDVILAISPFGFSVINRWNHNLLIYGGFVIIIGNTANPYLNNEKRLFDEADFQQEYTMLDENNIPSIAKSIIGKVKEVEEEKRGISNTTGLDNARKTPLNSFRVARKGTIGASYQAGLVGYENGIMQ
ncbi:Putative uncharacterized protein [Mycoavidus cysteinexigens]|uniref:Uncharacterized protein n=1 Tax=Mycoavidus cysteinexigens TaxID=1553431 RepID=A0A2Z6ES13_9BURK|nr:hypothetical protein [Mycoavidus cysteinexigens]BBE08189.1 Putative uncharacterized protein [Mycoavidus cysteinexigens]GLR01983.1 hypothetical protein GCM10007934_17960 [Mycoavidus cysteinexigens]